MTKDELLDTAKILYKEAFEANVSLAIIQQYPQFNKEYKQEMQLSSVFYSVTYKALLKACFMDVAKIFDINGRNLMKLLKNCQEHKELFSGYSVNGKQYALNEKHDHYIKPNEECLYKECVEHQRKIDSEIINFLKQNRSLRDTHQIMGEYSNDSPSRIPIQMSFDELLDLYCKKYRSLSKKIDNIREQRNKIYAHNDEENLQSIETVLQKYSISKTDMQELIDFALDVTIFVMESLAGNLYATHYSHIDDLLITLQLVRIGLKYL